MDAIQMVDLKKQYQKIKGDVDKAVLDVLASSAFINGKPVQDFSSNLAKYWGVKHVIPCANGTDALQIAMMALDLQPGDEVITPSFTYIATTEVVALLKLKPVFVDVDPETFCIDPQEIEKAITPNTKAIVPVHLYGHAAPMEEILAIAEKHNLFVIEDTAQAMGAEYKFSDGRIAKAGSLGTIGCTSFFPSKNLGCYGDGGAIATNDDSLAEKLRMIANHGQKVRYYHDMIGCNSRLDTIQAAILDIKLRHLDEYNKARTEAADYYDEAFKDVPQITVPFRAPYTRHAFHQYTLKLEGVDRDGLSQYLATKGIPSMIYYPVPSHRQKAFENFGGASFDLPVTDWLTSRVISLPMHTELWKDQQDFIIEEVKNFINGL
ncbi:MAG: DegT/DnrJ/EryC1/StrS family aminotransferase [Chitinophagaceae bacterium]|nr:DegT/DnrJ/EryC1/StrS family aminotransferase [Chitinophagaceae bacterium]